MIGQLPVKLEEMGMFSDEVKRLELFGVQYADLRNTELAASPILPAGSTVPDDDDLERTARGTYFWRPAAFRWLTGQLSR